MGTAFLLGWHIWGDGELSQPLGQFWYNLDPSSLNFTQVVFERYLYLDEVWFWLTRNFLSLDTIVILPALALFFLGLSLTFFKASQRKMRRRHLDTVAAGTF